jgi:hypothetical protein
MANEFNVRRVAVGNFSMPTNTAANTASTLSVGAGVYIPAGAIVTGIKFLPAGALSNAANFKSATVNLYVGTLVIGTDDRVASAAIVQTAVGSLAPKAADGVYVPAGGEVIIHFASSDSARTGIAFDSDVYVEYLYCSDRDIA